MSRCRIAGIVIWDESREVANDTGPILLVIPPIIDVLIGKTETGALNTRSRGTKVKANSTKKNV